MSTWVDQVFQSQIAKRDGVVRRKVSSTNNYASQSAVKPKAKTKAKNLGYHIVQHGDQWLIFCDKASVKIIA